MRVHPRRPPRLHNHLMVRWDDVRREPFRILFPLGIFCGILGVGHWLLYALHWAPASSSFFHASLQTWAYMYGFIAGFLMTALPRFAAAEPATSRELGLTLGLLAAQVIALSIGWWALAQACAAGLLLALATFAGRRFARRRSPVGPPVEFVWVPLGLVLGVVGLGLLIGSRAGGSPAWLAAAGRPLAQQGFLLAVVTGVGGFMAPRLFGREVLLVTPAGASAAEARRLRLERLFLHAGAGAVFVLSFVVEGAGRIGPAYLVRALAVTSVLSWTARLHRRPRVGDRYVWLLWISLWMVVLGLWGAGLAPRYRVAMLHVTFLGGLSLMTFAVGTMVVLSHAGEGTRLRGPLWVLRVVATALAVALGARVLADVWPPRYFLLLGIASAAWLIGGVSWLAFILPRVLRPSSPGAFEEIHEAAKRRLLRHGSSVGDPQTFA